MLFDDVLIIRADNNNSISQTRRRKCYGGSHPICKVAYFTVNRADFENHRPRPTQNMGCIAFFNPFRIQNATLEGSDTHNLLGFTTKNITGRGIEYGPADHYGQRDNVPRAFL